MVDVFFLVLKDDGTSGCFTLLLAKEYRRRRFFDVTSHWPLIMVDLRGYHGVSSNYQFPHYALWGIIAKSPNFSFRILGRWYHPLLTIMEFSSDWTVQDDRWMDVWAMTSQVLFALEPPVADFQTMNCKVELEFWWDWYIYIYIHTCMYLCSLYMILYI